MFQFNPTNLTVSISLGVIQVVVILDESQDLSSDEAGANSCDFGNHDFFQKCTGDENNFIVCINQSFTVNPDSLTSVGNVGRLDFISRLFVLAFELTLYC